MSRVFVFWTGLCYYNVNKNNSKNMNKPKIVDRKELSKEINKKYIEMWELFQNNSIDESIFTDNFLEIYEELQNKVFLLLSSSKKNQHDKLEENIEKLFQNTFRKAILSIIKINSVNTQNLDFGIFKSKWMLRLRWWKSKIEFRQWDKYNEFLRMYSELFFWRKDVQIKTYVEKLDSNKIRKSPYYIINIIWKDFSKTLLISDQIWEATFVYNWMIESDKFVEIEKWQEVDGLKPIKVVYSESYSNELKELITQKKLYSYEESEISDEDLQLKEEEYFNKLYLKTVLSSITDNKWNKINEDLNTIWVVRFRELYFWTNTKYWKISWQRLLKNNWWANNIVLKKVLGLIGIDRKKLATIKLDYENNEHIIKLLNNITDDKWKKIVVDFENISLLEFSKLNLWYDTNLWEIVWITLLTNKWGESNIWLRNIFKIIWIERLDLPSQVVDYNNKTHIKELLDNVTDKDWNKLKLDFKSIWLEKFKKLYFWYSTKFWKLMWYTILNNSWWENTKVLKKILELWWIKRLDLAHEDIKFNNPEHIKEVLSIPTDREWRAVKINLNTIRMKEFSNLYFWYGTRFWLVTWQSLLIKNWKVNNQTVRKVLKLIWIERLDLPE